MKTEYLEHSSGAGSGRRFCLLRDPLRKGRIPELCAVLKIEIKSRYSLIKADIE